MISEAFTWSLIAATSAPLQRLAGGHVLLLLRREARLGGGDHQHLVEPVKMRGRLHDDVDKGRRGRDRATTFSTTPTGSPRGKIRSPPAVSTFSPA